MDHQRLALVLPLCLALTCITGCGKAPPPADPIRPVRAMKVADVQQLAGRPFPGQAVPNEEVDLALRVGGPLMELPVKAGDQVTKDKLLARIDPRDYEVRIQTYEGELLAAEASSKQAQLEFARIKKLFDEQATTQQELDRKKALVDLTAGQKKALEGKLQGALDELKYTQLLAPFDGMVATTYAENFQTVKPQERVLRLLDLSRIKFQIDLPEKAMPLLRYVKSVEVTIQPFPGRTFPATIHEVAHEASRQTRTYRVTLLMDQPKDVKILPGMTGDARGKAELPPDIASRGLEILPSAMFEAEGKSFVWVFDEATKKVRRQAVKPSRLSENTLVVEGLTPGQWVVTAGVNYLKEGQEVRLLDDDEAAAKPAKPAPQPSAQGASDARSAAR